ncbi:MAG: hypothetical protein V1676_01820 [Candidatus Diapherotrites archaeon]
MLMNALSHLLALDIAWFIGLIAGNWVMFFALLAFAHYFSPKRWLAFFALFVLILWGWMDVATLTGWAFLIAGFILLNYLWKVVLVGYIESTSLPSNYIVIINELSVTAMWVLYGMFVIGGA